MYRKFLHLSLIIIILLHELSAKGQVKDTTRISIYPRFSFYTYENAGEFLLHIPSGFRGSNMTIKIYIDGRLHDSINTRAVKTLLQIPFTIDFSDTIHPVTADITVPWRKGLIYEAKTDLQALKYKPNEVKTDRLTGGLIVNKRQFFPYGFYCYTPLSPTLPAEEAIRGFNLISPYQKILPETFSERKAYMDRCAQLGLKVNYNLLSVSGGGGVGSKIDGITEKEKHERLIREIEAFRDHPALLGWYISDEPNGYKIPPEKLEDIYETVKKMDPYHPVSIVFMAPFISAKNYSDALDIVMADPYPVPRLPVSLVGNVTKQLSDEFRGKKPVWIVPQAFGGGEIWEREPTPQEIRSMTWQSIIEGATGIEFFVRQGPNYFPKSMAAWDECSRIATEVAELTPWLLSDEDSYQVISYSPGVLTTSRLHNGQIAVMAVNKSNSPVNASIRIKGFGYGKARVLFENRTISIRGGIISDQISPYGSQVYMIDSDNKNTQTADNKNNLLRDPGFEDMSTPGIPTACYARPGGDRGATYFLDTREHHSGDHSLRLITPEQDKGVSVRFFPFKVMPGKTYVISLWAKSDPDQRFFIVTKKKKDRLLVKKDTPQYVEVSLGNFGKARFVPGRTWKEYMIFVTVPEDSIPGFRTNMVLSMPGQGVAWFDDIKVFEEK
ncbi:MAG TPA: hypothetical protein VJ963_05595 [Bacteroidales bacterium]|nr:hypothetical protein [Bacteroidales bacterium]